MNSSEIRFASALDFPVNFVSGVYREHEHQLLNVQVITTNGLGLPTGPFCSNNSCDALTYPGAGTTFFGRSDERWITHRVSATWVRYCTSAHTACCV